MPELTIEVEAATTNVFSIGNSRNTYTRASLFAKLSARLSKTTTALRTSKQRHRESQTAAVPASIKTAKVTTTTIAATTATLAAIITEASAS